MPIFKKESLEALKQRIDLIEVVSSYVDLKRSGATYKGLCPFHDEKTPSFVVQRGDNHYHCFGCGAHGDALQFLMSYLKMSFKDAVEYLAEKFHVTLETVSLDQSYKGPSKKKLKEALNVACQMFQTYLLHSKEGHVALDYLYGRGLDLTFIQTFQIGLCPPKGMLTSFMRKEGFSDSVLEQSGLIRKNEAKAVLEYFADRITFPVRDAQGAVIGFSARKFKEETFGGKYINTPETPLFKKSKILYGLNYCRKEIAKQRRVVIVEGQIDCLRLIKEGLNITVAGQGTAFGKLHVQELLNLGVTTVYLALDSDEAGRKAARKIGDLFQQKGVEVFVVFLPEGKDPDSIVCEEGVDEFVRLLKLSDDYLTFLVQCYSEEYDLNSPAGKNALIHYISKQIRQWEDEVMVHESLRKLANLVQVPEALVQYNPSSFSYVKYSATLKNEQVDLNQAMELDLLRWFLFSSSLAPRLKELIKLNISSDDFFDPICKSIYEKLLQKQDPVDLMQLSLECENIEEQKLLQKLLDAKVTKQKAKERVKQAIEKILNRNWLAKRDQVRIQIQSGNLTDEEALKLAKKFSDLLQAKPKIKEVEEAYVSR